MYFLSTVQLYPLENYIHLNILQYIHLCFFNTVQLYPLEYITVYDILGVPLKLYPLLVNFIFSYLMVALFLLYIWNYM